MRQTNPGWTQKIPVFSKIPRPALHRPLKGLSYWPPGLLSLAVKRQRYSWSLCCGSEYMEPHLYALYVMCHKTLTEVGLP